MELFISPPNTTGVTQMLDQVNRNLHSQYREVKADLFTPNFIVNREVFMVILTEVWPSWTNDKFLVKADKRFGIAKDGLSVHLMQQDKFETAAKCIRSSNKKMDTADNLAISSPVGIRKGTAEYYKVKIENAQKVIARLNPSTPSLEEIGLLTIKKVIPKVKSANVRVTQYHGSMGGKMCWHLLQRQKKTKN